MHGTKHPYGKAVVGAEDAARQREVKATKSSVYGRKVIGRPDPVAEPAGQPEQNSADELVRGPLSGEMVGPQDAAISVSTLAQLLEAEPHQLDRQIDAEFLRPDPRKSAFRMFLAVEQRRDGGPRPEVVQLIERALQGTPAAVEPTTE